jgi:hypothetical protein
MPEKLNEIENSSLEDSPDRKTKIRKPNQNMKNNKTKRIAANKHNKNNSKNKK